MTPITVFLVEDHELMRAGIREALEAELDIQVIGEAARVNGATVGILKASPNIVLLDIRLEDGSGIELCRELLETDSSIRCLMFTSATDDEPILQSILAGASGYLSKDSPRGHLIHAIRTVARGGSMIDSLTTERMMNLLRKAHEEKALGLTDQEQRVLDLIGSGLTNREIAEQLHLAHQTVKNYVSRVLTKLAMDRTRAALYSASGRRRSDL